MRWSIPIGNVIACALRQDISVATLMLHDESARNDEDNVALVTPVVRNVSRAVFDKTKLDISKLPRTHDCRTGLARVRGRGNLPPIRDADGQTLEIHVLFLTQPQLLEVFAEYIELLEIVEIDPLPGTHRSLTAPSANDILPSWGNVPRI